VHVSRIVAVVVGAVLVLATVVSAVVGFSHDARERDVATADVRRAALQSLTSELDGIVATTHQVAELFAASHEVSPAEFRTFTLPMLRDGGATAFAFAPHVRDADRAAWERRHGARIVWPGIGRLRAAPRRASYDPVLLRLTLLDVRLPPPGSDIASDPLRSGVMRSAIALRTPQSTPVIPLASTSVLGILVFAPAFDERGELLGTAVGSSQVGLLARAIAGVLPNGAAFELRQGRRRVAAHGHLRAEPDHWAVDLAGQQWEIVTSAAPRTGLSEGVIALLIGGLLTAVVVLGLSGLAREAGRAQRMASRNEERFAHAFDHAPVGMALLDAHCRHVRVNEAMAQMLGHTRESLTGLPAEDVMPPEDAAACRRLVKALLRGAQRSFRGDSTLLTADGRRLLVAVHMTLLGRTDARDAPILVHTVDVTEQRLAERRMQHLADHDPLTGLLNRRGFAAALENQVAHWRRYGSGGALLILDLDGFKAVNDALGHDAGDRLLVRVAEELRACLRDTDVIARLGGDEFAVILPRESIDDAALVAAKVNRRLREATLGAGPERRAVTVSVGVAAFDDDFREGEDVLRAADLAMYSAKAAGRDRHAVHGRHADLV
jgi:diguanylate cyclase (GGDEF)-like protein/PAS domain S-box-containing protein